MVEKTLQQHFREQAELIDQLFTYRFEESDKKWDATLDAKLDSKLERLENSLAAQIDARLESKLAPIRNDVTAVKHAVKVLLARLTS